MNLDALEKKTGIVCPECVGKTQEEVAKMTTDELLNDMRRLVQLQEQVNAAIGAAKKVLDERLKSVGLPGVFPPTVRPPVLPNIPRTPIPSIPPYGDEEGGGWPKTPIAPRRPDGPWFPRPMTPMCSERGTLQPPPPSRPAPPNAMFPEHEPWSECVARMGEIRRRAERLAAGVAWRRMAVDAHNDLRECEGKR